MNIIDTLIGAVISYGITKVPTLISLYKKRKIGKEVENRKLAQKNGSIYNWLIQYYTKNNDINDLYPCRFNGYEARIPILTHNSWNKPINLLDHQDLMEFSDSNNDFPVDNKSIEKRKALGQTLFNSPTLYIDRLEENESGSLKFYVKKCSYFQMLKVLISIEDETFNAIFSKKSKRLQIRENLCKNLSVAREVRVKPSSIGCQTVLAFKNGASYDIVIQTRSHSTITFGGCKAAIPSFGLSPLPTGASENNILFYNFLKEYCEELFDYDELIHEMETNRAEPLWFYNILPEAIKIRNLIKKNKFIFEYLGFGFDGLNGSATVALLAVIDDTKEATTIKQRIHANWEVKDVDCEKSIEIVGMNSPQFMNWLKSKNYHYGSMFAINLATKRLEQLLNK